jgi:hypothetical protein
MKQKIDPRKSAGTIKIVGGYSGWFKRYYNSHI